MAKTVQRVLIYRLGSLGDTLIALPALHLIARTFPHAERRLLTNFPVNTKAPPAAAIVENTDLIQGFFRYVVGTRSPQELFLLWWNLLRWRPQVLIYLGAARGIPSARRDSIFFRLCGISRMIGIPLTEDMQQNRWLQASGAFEAEASRLARNIEELGDAQLDDPVSWDLRLTEAEHARAREVVSPAAGLPLIAVGVGTKVQAKDWGREKWRDLLQHLAKLYPGYALALCGAPEEFEVSHFAGTGWDAGNSAKPFLNLCGKLTPRESAAVLARSRIFVGHDSGPMHLAAAVQTPCVAIFAARNLPRVWFPYGSQNRVLYHHVDCAGCGLETCIAQRKKCIVSITVDEVLEQIRAVIG